MAPAAPITPLSALRVSSHPIPAFHRFPNTSATHQDLRVYHSAFQPGTPAATIEAHLRAVGVVEPQWRYTMYRTSHFHSTAHEVLCVSAGTATLCFGGEANPHRIETSVTAGDVMVVPAGLAHRLLHDRDGGFEMVGSYPRGTGWDMCYGKDGDEDRVKAIQALGWFARDPIYGDQGPVLDA